MHVSWSKSSGLLSVIHSAGSVRGIIALFAFVLTSFWGRGVWMKMLNDDAESHYGQTGATYGEAERWRWYWPGEVPPFPITWWWSRWQPGAGIQILGTGSRGMTGRDQVGEFKDELTEIR